MKTTLLLATAILLSLSPLSRAQETEKLMYPDADHTSFIIHVPTDWKLTQGETEGDYCHLHGPSGAVFSFRTIDGDQHSLEEAMKNSLEQMNKKFTDTEIGDAQDWKPDGMTGFYAVGQGKESDGNEVKIGMGWCALKDGKIAEWWFVTDIKDSEGMTQANNIANSLEAP
jgi:hypothetical protein